MKNGRSQEFKMVESKPINSIAIHTRAQAQLNMQYQANPNSERLTHVPVWYQSSLVTV